MNLQTAADLFIKSWQKESEKKLTIALFGQPGSGKSSLINELVGEKVAEVSAQTDTTKVAQIVDYNDAIFVDLPGYDTSSFPANKYFSSFSPFQYDLFICVFSNKLVQADKDFFRKIRMSLRECIFVRNKVDSLYDATKSKDELKKEIREDVAEQIGTPQEIIFTSCRRNEAPEARGITELQAAIQKHLTPAMQDKFNRCAKAYTYQLLEEKRELALSEIRKASAMAAGNGLNPIIGVDMGIDARIMSAMYARIRKTFAITELEIENYKGSSSLISKISMGIKKDNIISAMKTQLSKQMEKKFSKYIPVIGQATAMGLSAGGMYYLGKSYLDSCYEYAEKRLEAEISMRTK
jgi:GTP-binding protein EngB required for normal cell division